MMVRSSRLFPRILTDPNVSADLANNSEVYVTTIAARPPFGEVTILNGASFGRDRAGQIDCAIQHCSRAGAPSHTQPSRRGECPMAVFRAHPRRNSTYQLKGRRAPVFYVSPGEVHFLVPKEIESGLARLLLPTPTAFAVAAQFWFVQALLASSQVVARAVMKA